jgi:hypothetical protein
MSGLYFLFPSLLAILVSFLVVRAASVALILTGMEKHKARFQALSAFSGTGFTTREAESVVNHPQRRKIITWLIIFGNAGIVAVIVTTTTSFANSKTHHIPITLVVLALGIFLIYKVANYKKFTTKWERFIEKKLLKSQTFEEAATEDLLHFLEGYGLVEKIVRSGSALIGRSLRESQLREKGAIVLGIERGKSWISVPKAGERINEEDRLVVYGPLKVLKSVLKEAGN